MTDENEREDLERVIIQLANCSIVALGGSPVISRSDWGWSQSYQDVLDLKNKYDTLISKLNGAEAIIGFVAWLTGRKEVARFGSSFEVGKAVELAKQFCEINYLEITDEHWTDKLIMPEN